MNSLFTLVVIMNSFIVTLGDNGNYTSKQLLNNNMTMLLSSDKLVIMKIDFVLRTCDNFHYHLFIRRQYNIIIQKRYFLGFYYSTVKNDGLHRRSQFLMSSMRSGLTYKLATTTVSFFINIIHPSFNLNPSRILILLMKKKI